MINKQKPGLKMVYPELCKEPRRRISGFECGAVELELVGGVGGDQKKHGGFIHCNQFGGEHPIPFLELRKLTRALCWDVG